MSCTPNNLPVIYERDITNIYLQYFTEDEDTLVSTTDIDRLIEIAGKCPTVSGYAVYDAQAMLKVLNPEIEFDWVVNCENAGLRVAEDDVIEEQAEINNFVEPAIYPNPASDLIVISGLTGDERIIIYNAQGQTVKAAYVSDFATSIAVTDLANGVYTVSITGRTYRSIKKFIILR
jgi:hypothetical protein